MTPQLTAEQIRELHEGRESMRVYAATLPEGPEREEYETAIAETSTTLRAYAKADADDEKPAPVTAAQAMSDSQDAEADADADDDDADTDLNPDTAEGIEALRAMLEKEGYDVGGEEGEGTAADPMLAGGRAQKYSGGQDDALKRYAREDIQTRVGALVDGDKLTPHEGDVIVAALVGLIDAAAAVDGLKVYSREGGQTTAEGRVDAARDLLAVLGQREALGLAKTYTRMPAPAGQTTHKPLTLNVPDGVEVNPQSAQLATAIQALADERGVPFADAVKLYGKENPNIELKKY